MIRDLTLVVALQPERLVGLDFELLRNDIEEAVGSLNGSVWNSELRGTLAVWTLSCYIDQRSVEDRLRAVIPNALRWVLRGENRAEWGGLTSDEVKHVRSMYNLGA